MSEQAFWSSEVAKMLGVQDVTVRSWALRLEKHGYTFMRDSNDKRAYSERDISVLRFLQSQVQDKKLKLDDAARVTAERFQTDHQQEENGIMTIAIVEQQNALEARYDALFQVHSALLEELRETKQTQQEILKRLDQQEQQRKEEDQTFAAIKEQNEHMNRLENAIERRDQALMKALQEIGMLRKMEFDRQTRTFWQRLRGR